MPMTMGTLPAPSLCECGCGEPTNERQIEAWRLRGEGMKNVEIAELWSLDPASVKACLHRKPSRFINGHWTYSRMSGRTVEWTCQRCGSIGRASVGAPIPKFCQRRACLQSALPIWRAIGQSVEARAQRRRERLTSFFQRRALVIERRARRTKWETPAEKAKQALRVFAFKEMEHKEAERWIACQSDEVRDFIEAQAQDPKNLAELHLDRDLSSGPKPYTLGDIIPHGFEQGIDPEWIDPTPEPVIARWDSVGEAIPFADPRFFMWAKRAAILPHDYIDQCAMERLVLVVEDGEARFFVHRDRDLHWDLLPRWDDVSVVREQQAMQHGHQNILGSGTSRTQSRAQVWKSRDHGKAGEPLTDQTMKSLRKTEHVA